MSLSEQDLLRVVDRSVASNNIKQAIVACRELNILYPGSFDGWRLAGDIHRLAGKPEAVLFSTRKALHICPGDPGVTLQRIEAFLATGNNTAARSLLGEIDDARITAADMHDRLGQFMASMDLHADAMAQYEKALTYDPGNPALLFNLATAQRFMGHTSAAIATLDGALSINPNDYEAQAMRSSLATQSKASNHVEELRELLNGACLPDTGQTSICYALAKELDDLDDTQQSFHYLKRGADLRRSKMDYQVETDTDIMNELQRVYSVDFFDGSVDGIENDEPIFIVGMPRTGTTLVERILGSHSSVYSAGELDNFGREMIQQLHSSDSVNGTGQRDVIERCSRLNLAELGKAYIESTRPMTADLPRFIDKLPFNYLYLGLIHRALPNARIIELVRHPMATCYAVFKQLFRDPYPFSYDLHDLARYYLAYRDLMAHWHAVMPGVIHSVNYEDVVNDTESEARQLLEHCNLEWQDRCLRFYENEQAATTASAAQVRKPVYRTSLNRWEQYREHFEPLEAILIAAGVDTDVGEVHS